MAIADISLAEFSRSFALRAPRLHFFIGAGASVSSGVPSARDMVWDFKRQLFATETNVALERIGPLSDPTIQISLQRYFDGKAGYPSRDDDAEYKFYFERAYPSSHDRRLYIADVLKEKRPSYGYTCMGVLLATAKIRQVWTTNFDDLLERAYSVVAEGRAASVVGLDTTARLETYLRDERYPIVVKLHGDFRFDDIKNLSTEVAHMDIELREGLVDATSRYGLCVIGYSGRDASVMSALQTAIDRNGDAAFKDGLFWSLRDGEHLGEQARAVLEMAVNQRIPTAVVRISTFDEFATALYRVSGFSSKIVEEQLAGRKDARRGFVLYKGPKRDPVLKMNALPITAYPDTCYRFKTQVTGWKDLREIIGESDIAAGLHKGSVMALANQAEVRRVFAARGIDDLRPTPLSMDDLRISDSVVMGIFYEAILRALTSDGVLATAGRRTRIVYFDSGSNADAVTHNAYAALHLPTGPQLVRKSDPYWIHEAAEIGLDFREDRLWLLVRPTVMLTSDGNRQVWESEDKKEVIRELLATRYNQPVSALLNFWVNVLFGRTSNGRLTYPPQSETGFQFELAHALGFSYHQA